MYKHIDDFIVKRCIVLLCAPLINSSIVFYTALLRGPVHEFNWGAFATLFLYMSFCKTPKFFNMCFVHIRV